MQTTHASFASVENAIVKLHSDYQQVWAALAGLVGTDTKHNLDLMESRTYPGLHMLAREMDVIVAAIAALRETLPGGE